MERQGFNKYIQSGIVLTVSETATQNVTLPVRAVQQSVTVSGNTELINTTSAALSMVVNKYAVTQLPLNGRDPSTLVFLAPGETNVLNTGGGALQGGFSFQLKQVDHRMEAAREARTIFWMAYLMWILAAPFPNADATQEFRVITNNLDAHYGFAPGAVVKSLKEPSEGINSRQNVLRLVEQSP